MDILFYNSVKKNIKIYIFLLVYHLLQTPLFAIFLPIDILNIKTKSELVISFMSVGLAVSAFNVFINFLVLVVGYSNNKNNNLKFLMIAEIGHLVDEPLRNEHTNDLINCVSTTVYNQPNQTLISGEGLTD